MFRCSAFTTPGCRNRRTVVRTCRLEANSSSSECPEEGRAIDSDNLAARPNNHEKAALKENIKKGRRQIRWATGSCVITGPQETSQPSNEAGCRRLQIVTKGRSVTPPALLLYCFRLWKSRAVICDTEHGTGQSESCAISVCRDKSRTPYNFV